MAGESCYVLEYGAFDDQKSIQEAVREELQEDGDEISRPFYVIDVYDPISQFLFVYLDDGEDPVVYSARYSDLENMHPVRPKNLSKFIRSRIDRVKAGRNPF